MDNEIDDLIQEIKNTNKLGNFLVNSTTTPTTSSELLTDDNINDFILQKSALLIKHGTQTLEQLKDALMRGGTSEDVEAYAKLLTSVTMSVDVLNKVNIQNKKHTSAKEIKQLEIDNSKKLLEKYNDGTPNSKIQTQNNFIIATREEVMKAIVDKATTLAPPINVEFTEHPDS